MLRKLRKHYLTGCLNLWINYILFLCYLFHNVLKFKSWEKWVDEISMATHSCVNYLAPAMIVWAILV
jgi:hypothetical protein